MVNPLTSIANMFRPVTPTVNVAPPAPPMSVQNPGAVPPPTPQGSDPNQPPPNPLDSFKDLMQTDPNAKPHQDPFSTPVLNSDPAKIREASSKVDFLQHVPADVLQRVNAGNDPAAIAALVNAVAQQTLTMAAQLSAQTGETVSSRTSQRILDALPGRVRDIQLADVKPENPVLQHPAAQPLLQMARDAVRAKNPTMAPADVNAHAEKYLSTFASSFSQQGAQATADPNTPQEQNWDIFLKNGD